VIVQAVKVQRKWRSFFSHCSRYNYTITTANSDC